MIKSLQCYCKKQCNIQEQRVEAPSYRWHPLCFYLDALVVVIVNVYNIDSGAEPDFVLSKAESFYDRPALVEYINSLK